MVSADAGDRLPHRFKRHCIVLFEAAAFLSPYFRAISLLRFQICFLCLSSGRQSTAFLSCELRWQETNQKEGYKSSGPMRHQHIAIRKGSRVSPLAKLTAEERAQLRRARHLALLKLRRARHLALLRRWRLSTPGPTAKPGEKGADRESPERSLNMILSSVLLTIVIAAALTYALVTLMHPSSTRSKKGPALLAEAASMSQTASPVFVGTDHPVPVDPISLQTTSAKHESSNPVTAPTPEPSVVFEKNARREVEPLSREARE